MSSATLAATSVDTRKGVPTWNHGTCTTRLEELRREGQGFLLLSCGRETLGTALVWSGVEISGLKACHTVTVCKPSGYMSHALSNLRWKCAHAGVWQTGRAPGSSSQAEWR